MKATITPQRPWNKPETALAGIRAVSLLRLPLGLRILFRSFAGGLNYLWPPQSAGFGIKLLQPHVKSPVISIVKCEAHLLFERQFGFSDLNIASERSIVGVRMVIDTVLTAPVAVAKVVKMVVIELERAEYRSGQFVQGGIRRYCD